MTRTISILIVLGFAPVIASATPGTDPSIGGEVVPAETKPAKQRPVEHVPAAADVAGAPLPGHESGRIDGGDGGDSVARSFARGVLLFPRAAFALAMAPIRGGVWVNAEYHVYDRVHAVFFDATDTYGLYPTLRLQTGFGFTVGARFVHRDVLGHREHLALFAGTGGRFRTIASVGLDTGQLLGDRFRIETDGEFDRRPHEGYWGTGNADAAPVARYRQELARVAVTGDVRVVADLHARISGAATDLGFDRSETGVPIDEMYPPDDLVGFAGVRHVYGELELRWDDRGAVSRWEPVAIPAAGSVLGIWAGRVHRTDGAGADYTRYGVDAQTFLRLSPGPRTLILRGHAEAVDAARSDVPFAELPALGGTRDLRGYPTERFRDRVAAVVSAEYQFDLIRTLAASVFTDAGRVYPDVSSIDLTALRLGYGGALQWYGEHSLWIRATVASSIDGGLELMLSFSPVTELDGRVERR